MSNRVRLVETLACREADRAPFGVGLGFAPWGLTSARWREESGISDLWPAGYFGYDGGFQEVPLEYGTLPKFEHKVIADDGVMVTYRDERGITAQNPHDRSSMPDFIDYPVKSMADWEIYKRDHLQLLLDERTANLDKWAEGVEERDEAVVIGTFPWGLFGTPRDMMGAEELLVGFYTEEELVRDIMDTYTTLWLQIYEVAAAKVKIDRIHIWEDMSGRQGSLISMDMVRDFMMPHYDRLHEFAIAHGIPAISVDSDGMVGELVPTMMEHGVNAFEPFEVQAGNDIREYRKSYPGLAIIGGLDKNALADNAPAGAMHAELDKCEWMLGEGGYIPGCDHLIPPNVSWKKWCEWIAELKKLIGV